jgi:hypothetical protein
MAGDATDRTPAAEHAALRTAYEDLRERLEREERAHDRERAAHSVAIAQLALLRAEQPALVARARALADELETVRHAPLRQLAKSWRDFLNSNDELLVRLYLVLIRYPRLHRLARRLRRLLTLHWLSGTSTPTSASATAEPSALAGTAVAPAPPPPAEPDTLDLRFRVRPLPQATPLGGGKRLVCFTHVLPHPPRAGNEYRIGRMLTWLSRQGWQVLLVVCPLPGEEASEAQAREAASVFPHLIVCGRDGTLYSSLPAQARLDQLDGQAPRNFTATLGERAAWAREARRLVDIQRTFCPDFLIELLLHLETTLDPAVWLAEYIFMTRAFPLLKPPTLKAIDTIDVFSNKAKKVERYGVADSLAMSDEEEATLLNRANLLIAIQPEEAADLKRLAPEREVIETSMDFDLATPSPPPVAPVVLLIASDNRMNVKGLNDFLRFAWPLVREAVPQAELRIVGRVGEQAEAGSPGIRVLGRVEDIDAAYAQARVVINPAVAGTGLKTKTVEALCHFRPIVLWPSGLEGIAPEARSLCHVANDWFDFAQKLIDLLRSDAKVDLAAQERALHRFFAPDNVYAALARAVGAP